MRQTGVQFSSSRSSWTAVGPGTVPFHPTPRLPLVGRGWGLSWAKPYQTANDHGQPLEIPYSKTLSTRGTLQPPKASPRAIAHMVSPTPTSSQTQAAGLAKTGASPRAPNPSAAKKLSDPNAAATPKAS